MKKASARNSRCSGERAVKVRNCERPGVFSNESEIPILCLTRWFPVISPVTAFDGRILFVGNLVEGEQSSVLILRRRLLRGINIDNRGIDISYGKRRNNVQPCHRQGVAGEEVVSNCSSSDWLGIIVRRG